MNNPKLNFSITNTIADIPKDDWDRLFDKNLIEGFGYQKTLEESNPPQFTFGYLLGKRDNRLVAILPFFITKFSLAEFSKGLLRKPILGLQKVFPKFLKLKILFIGSVTTEELYLGISKDEDLNLIMDLALEKLREFSKNEKIDVLSFYDLSEKDKALSEYLEKKHFIKLEGLPTTLIEINAGSLEEFTKKLSKNARKDLKRKLRRSAELADLTTEMREDIKDISEEVYKLYLNNFGESDIHFEELPKEFFRNISQNMPGEAKFFITRDREKIVAFNLCLIKGDFCIDKFIGLDTEVAHKYYLYFTTLCHNIDWCIKNNIRFYQPGATDYHPKVRLGAKLIPLTIYAMGFNPLLNTWARLFPKLLAPRNMDPSLKDIERFKKEAPVSPRKD